MSVLKRILILALVGTVLLCCAGATLGGWLWSRAATSTAGEVEFVNRLAVPPLAPSSRDGAGRRVFDLRAAPGTHDFGAGAVRTWGFNGGYLGPTLRASRGEQVVVNVHNALPESTSVHWHGMHLPAAMDGGPNQPVRRGKTWSPTWRVDQPAATLWYHPHPHDETSRHVYRGLAGMFIVDDPGTDAPALPRRYGVDDFPVIVQDKRFTDDGRLDETEPFLSDVGIIGDRVTVNGTLAPYLDVTTERVRLRLLNASNGRLFQFGFADDREFALVGTDGGLLAAPHRTRSVPMSPGERAEIVVSVRPGERAVLRSIPSELGVDPFNRRFSGAADTLDILQLRAARELAGGPAVPERLVDVPRLDPAAAVQQRSFRMSGNSINGRSMNARRVDATVVKDSIERWRITNEDGRPHSFHVHDVQFQVVSEGGRTPPPHLRGWKDTVFLRPGTPVEIVAKFADYADPRTPYMFHCHVLDHEDDGMMGQFVVVERGHQAGSVNGHDHGG